MTEPTPGPWRIELLKRTTGWIIRGPQDESITDGPIWTEHFAEESKANAHLIAAAPETAAERDRLREVNAELAAALGACVEAWDNDGSDEPSEAAYGSAVRQALAVLAKHRDTSPTPAGEGGTP